MSAKERALRSKMRGVCLNTATKKELLEVTALTEADVNVILRMRGDNGQLERSTLFGEITLTEQQLQELRLGGRKKRKVYMVICISMERKNRWRREIRGFGCVESPGLRKVFQRWRLRTVRQDHLKDVHKELQQKGMSVVARCRVRQQSSHMGSLWLAGMSKRELLLQNQSSGAARCRRMQQSLFLILSVQKGILKQSIGKVTMVHQSRWNQGKNQGRKLFDWCSGMFFMLTWHCWLAQTFNYGEMCKISRCLSINMTLQKLSQVCAWGCHTDCCFVVRCQRTDNQQNDLE